MSDSFVTVIATEDGAREKFIAAMSHAKALLRNGGHVQLSVGPAIESVSVKQRGFFHAAVLPQIAEQVRVEGARYTSDIWKAHLKTLFLPDTWEMRKVPRWDAKLCRLVQPKRATPHRVRHSTEELGVKGYAKFIDDCIDYATLEWNVQFNFEPSEREAVRHVQRPRKEKQQ